MSSAIRSMDLDALRREFQSASPYPFFKIDGFLEESFARRVVSEYPTYEAARGIGKEFNALNERLKVQITDKGQFPPAVARLSDELSSQEFLQKIEYITGIKSLLDDPLLNGGGMHMTGPGGRLDVHVDFNLDAEKKMHRRLNILVYLNENWRAEWGGRIELWNQDVTKCERSYEPIFNRCVVFETSEASFHGVTPVRCPEGVLRRSFAAYYYTKEAPAGWDGMEHSTVFKARPDEVLRGRVLMPLKQMCESAASTVGAIKKSVKRIVRRNADK